VTVNWAAGGITAVDPFALYRQPAETRAILATRVYEGVGADGTGSANCDSDSWHHRGCRLDSGRLTVVVVAWRNTQATLRQQRTMAADERLWQEQREVYRQLAE
jgi:hypothetical protein